VKAPNPDAKILEFLCCTSPIADTNRDEILFAEGYGVAPDRLGLHIEVLDCQKRHPGVDYSTALVLTERERELNFTEPGYGRAVEVHKKAIQHQKEYPSMDYLTAIKKVNQGRS